MFQFGGRGALFGGAKPTVVPPVATGLRGALHRCTDPFWKIF